MTDPLPPPGYSFIAHLKGIGLLAVVGLLSCALVLAMNDPGGFQVTLVLGSLIGPWLFFMVLRPGNGRAPDRAPPPPR